MHHISKLEKHMFHLAKKAAKQSDYDGEHVGAVVLYKKKAVGVGHNGNKTHPLQKKYNRHRKLNHTEGKYVAHKVHAEVDAINHVPYLVGREMDWSKAALFVFRLSKQNDSGHALAKPCEACMHLIQELGVQHVYYTEDVGYSHLFLNEKL